LSSQTTNEMSHMTTPSDSHAITASELAARSGAVLSAVEEGETYAVTRHGKPVAVIRPVSAKDDVSSHDVRPTAQEDSASYGRSVVPEAARHPETALTRLFGSKAMRSMMTVFVREPDARVYQRQIAREAGVGLRSAQIALDRLENLGFVESERDGNRRYYHAVRSARFEDLRQLLSRELGIVGVIARHLRPLESSVEWAFVFGSAASGEDQAGSDIDLLVVGDVSDDDLVTPIAEAQRELAREIEVVSYRQDEFERKRTAGNHFVRSVLAQPRLDVIGGGE
jgi:prevent-host-death family protein